MKQFITTVAMLAMISTPAFAQKKKKTTVHTTPTTTTTTTTTTTPSAPVYSYNGGNTSTAASGPNFAVAATLGSVGGAFTIGPSFYAEWPMTLEGNDFAFGAQTGFWFFDGGWAIPVMATGKYTFHVSGSIKPYVAVGLGIALLHANGVSFTNPFTGTTTTGGSDTSVKFAFLARPGINFGQADKFFAELPLGTIGSGFAILPTFGLRF
jgi:hypothetical protein